MKGIIPSFSYTVWIEMQPVWGVKTVNNISSELKYEVYTEGGLNDKPYMIPQPVTDIKTLEINARVAAEPVQGMAGSIYPVGQRFKLPVYVGVRLPEDGAKGISFAFTGCTVIRQSFSELDGESSRLLETTLTLAYEKLYVLSGKCIQI